MNVTAREALEECLTIIEGRRRAISRNLAGYAPKPGYEAQFDADTEKLQRIREVLQEIQRPEKDWQRVIEDEDARGTREALRFDEDGNPEQVKIDYHPELVRKIAWDGGKSE